MGLRDTLHDRVDMREQLANDAIDVVERVIKDGLARALDSTDSVEDAMTMLAAAVAAELDAVSTKAVKEGARLARVRGGK